MKYLFPFLLLTIFACDFREKPTVATSHKGQNLRTEQEYENVKSLANAVRSGVIDSCVMHGELAFEEMVKITPKMYQMIKHGNFNGKTCNFVNSKLGDIKQYSLVEAFKSKDRLLKIFRYKLISDILDFPIELRITFTDQNKLTEYRFFKWEESYSEDLILMNWN